MIIAAKKPCEIGEVIEFFQKEFGNSPSARGVVLREATLEEFMAADHPTSTKQDLEDYFRRPYQYHYEVSTD